MRKAFTGRGVSRFGRGISFRRLSSGLTGGEVAADGRAETFAVLPGPDSVCGLYTSKEATFWVTSLPHLEATTLTCRDSPQVTGRIQVSLSW